MQAFLAVLLEDLRKRRILFGLAAFLGLAAVCLPVFVSNRALPPDDLRQAAALAFLGLFVVLTPLFLGADLFAPGQASGRQGFFLARPIRPWQFLWGRLTSAFAACFGGVFLILLPSWLLGVDFFSLLVTESWESLRHMISFTNPSLRFVLYLPGFGPGTDLSPLVLILLPAILLALGHALSVFVRLAGGWSLFDLLAALCFGQMALSGHLELLSLHAKVSVWPFFAWIFLGASLLGLWLQLRRGGTERSRLHRIFSLSLAIPLLLAAFAAEIWIDRLEERGPQVLERVHFAASSASGDRALVVGDLGTHVGAFLVDRESGTWRHFPIVDSWHFPRFVADDLFWTRCIVDAGATRLSDATCRLLSLRQVEARHGEGETPDLRHLAPGVGLELGDTADPRHFDVRADARQVAVFRDGALELVSWPETKTARSVRLVQDPLWIRYDEGGTLRTWSEVVGPDGTSRQILVSELGAEGLRPVARFEGGFRDLPPELSPSRSDLGLDAPTSWSFDRDASCLTVPDDGERYCFGEFSGPA